MLTLGERLRRYRDRLKWSQNYLARISGVPQSTISQIEAGIIQTPTYQTIEALADALGVDVRHLGGGEEYEELRASGTGETPIQPVPDTVTDHLE